MIIYLEKSLKNNPKALNIIAKYPWAQVLEIDNYKNIFDKTLAWTTKKSIIIAKVNNALTKIPDNYGHTQDWYFFKNSLNCVYDCEYCYLKWAFKNDIEVFFVNYDDVKSQIKNVVENSNSNIEKWFYSSDYSDNLATDNITNFCEEFIPFFDTLENAKMEIRTKSVNVSKLLKMQPAKNTEIAFSLNPESIISKYEHKTPSLDLRIKAINALLNAGWLVWVRFIPLLEVPDYEKIYREFVEYVVKNIDFTKINSVFIGWLLYTKDDYNKIVNKNPHFELLYNLEKNCDGYFRETRAARDFFYKIFDENIKIKCRRCLDE